MYDFLIADEDNRVRFPKGVEPSFINASWIKSEVPGKARFIATQGPLPDTIGPFWRMVVQEQVPIIVMVCNLIEAERVGKHDTE